MSDVTGSSLGRLIAAFNGSRWPQKEGRVKCDYCLHELADGEQATVYVSDTDYTNPDRGFKMYATYCVECRRQRVYYPAQGANELMVAVEHRDGVIAHADVESVSPASEGRDWQPDRVFAHIMDIDFSNFRDEVAQTRPWFANAGISAGQVVDLLLTMRLDPHNFLTGDGGIDVSEDSFRELEMAIDRMQRSGGTAKDNVRDNAQYRPWLEAGDE